MSTFAGYVVPGLSGQTGAGNRYTSPDRSANYTVGLVLPAEYERGVLLQNPTSGQLVVSAKVTRAPVTHGGYVDPGTGRFWFELVHSVPAFFELGNILTTLSRDIEIYNSYREEARQLQVATNNADVGVSFSGLPALPYSIAAQTGLVFQVLVGTNGPPNLDGTLDFTLDTESLSIPITGVRVVMFPFEPESPIVETLEFLTTVLTSANGKEQRISPRKNPRQIFEMHVFAEEGSERRKLQTLMFGWQPGIFGVPVWFEARHLEADASIGASSVTVDTTYGDFRVGSLAIVWSSSGVFDALEISSKTNGSLTFSSPLTHDHVAGQALVMPLRVAMLDQDLSVDRYRTNLDSMKLLFRVVDNDVDLADTSAFPSYDGKVLLSEENMMTGETLPVNLTRELLRHDNEVAPPIQSSDWPGPHYLTQKGFFCRTPQRRWEVRQLLHALRGQQVSFYLPTFYHDMVLADNLTLNSNLMDIENIGYATYIDGQAPNNHVRIELASGTVYHREIISATVVSDSIERLTVDAVWPANVNTADVERISYLKLCRFANDAIQMEHNNSGESLVVVPVREVSQ